MEYKRFGNKIVVRIDKGEEVIEKITFVSEKEGIKLGSISGIGATDNVKIGLFDPIKKKYFSQELIGNFEIAPLSGNISKMDGKMYLHIHINVCDEKQNSFGGHLNHAYVSATCEVVIDIFDGEIDRKFSDDVGLNLIEF